MRVIAGKYKSRRLKTPGTLRMRPTSDRLRETLFNILGPAVEDSLFIDAYAGTGAVGIEAMSRGAREVFVIESHAASARLARQNVEALGISGACVLESDVIQGLQKIAARHLLADFIFLDPPYAKKEEYLRVFGFLDTSRLIAPAGLVIAEHHIRHELPERFTKIERVRLLEQGDTALSFYRLAAAA